MVRSLKLSLPFPPSSNTAYPTVVKGRKAIRVKSKKLKDWIRDAPDIDEKLEGQFYISYRIYFPDDRERDGQNYMKVPLDYLVSQGVFKDDNRKYIKGEQWLDMGNDKDNPRIEIDIRHVDRG